MKDKCITFNINNLCWRNLTGAGEKNVIRSTRFGVDGKHGEAGRDDFVLILSTITLIKKITDCFGVRILASCLVKSALTNVPNPLDDIMVTVVKLRLKHL